MNQKHDKLIDDLSKKYISSNEFVLKKSCNDIKNELSNYKKQLNILKFKLDDFQTLNKKNQTLKFKLYESVNSKNIIQNK